MEVAYFFIGAAVGLVLGLWAGGKFDNPDRSLFQIIGFTRAGPTPWQRARLQLVRDMVAHKVWSPTVETELPRLMALIERGSALPR